MSVKNIVVASHNQHKIKEITQMMGDFMEFKSLKDIKFYEEIEESGTSFHENAKIKSSFIFDRLGLNVMSDDSGLEVELLGGAPGVYSARYAGDKKDDKANIDKVLSQLLNSPQRKARFVTVISLYLNSRHYFFEGYVEGVITSKPVGLNGFGYDPIFKPAGSDRTFAQMSDEEKNLMSHRFRALDKMRQFLEHKKSLA